MPSIGKNIRKIRREKDLSQEQLANFILCTRATISNWEREITTPSRYDIARVAAAFGCSENDLTEAQ